VTYWKCFESQSGEGKAYTTGLYVGKKKKKKVGERKVIIPAPPPLSF